MQPIRRPSNTAWPIGLMAVGGFVLWAGVDDASAVSVSGAATSVGVAATLATLILVKGWQSHLGLDGLSTLAGLFALATGAGLLWRSGVGFRAVGFARTSRRSATAVVRPPVVLPCDVDHAALLGGLRRFFFELQAAWDAGEQDAMSRMTTPDLLIELRTARTAAGATAQRTEFLALEAELLLFERRESAQLVCVEYSGMVREVPAGESAPFREFWMLTRPEDASADWRLVRHQGLF